MSYLLAEITGAAAVAEGSSHFPVAATATIAIGFTAATLIGSVAWYNSKRPVGWKDKERPEGVPSID